jgi:hypothetical protein
VAARPISATRLASIRLVRAESDGASGPAGDRTANSPGSCMCAANSLLSPWTHIPKPLGGEPLPSDGARSILL